MATFDLKKQLTIHDRGLLRQLLGKEPSMQGIDWGAMPRNKIDPLIAAWEELEDAQKRHYQVVLQDVQHLADPKGQRVLIEELEWRHPGSLVQFAALLSPSDKALWAFLKAICSIACSHSPAIQFASIPACEDPIQCMSQFYSEREKLLDLRYSLNFLCRSMSGP